MKLLLDENLSYRLLKRLHPDFSGSAHPRQVEMLGATDAQLWEYAAAHGFTIVSKDNDFRQRVFLFGPPPQVIWLHVGNAGTDEIADIVNQDRKRILEFGRSGKSGLLVVDKAAHG